MNGNGMMAGMQVASLIDRARKAANAKNFQKGLDEYNLSDDDDDDEKYNQFKGNGHMNGNGMHQLRLAAKTKAARMALRNNNNNNNIWTANPIEEEEIDSPAYHFRNKDIPM